MFNFFQVAKVIKSVLRKRGKGQPVKTILEKYGKTSKLAT